MSLAERVLRRTAPAALFLVLAVLGSIALQPLAPQGHIILLLMATILAGWFGGRAAGVGTGLASFVCAIYFFMPPLWHLAVMSELQPTAFLLAGALLGAGWLSGEWRFGRDDLQESREQYSALLDGIRDHAVFLLDAEGDIATWNAGAQRLKGYTAEEVLGKNLSIYYPKEDVEKGKPQELLRAATANGSVTTEGWRLRKDGTQFWAEVSLTALFEPDGSVKGFAKIIRDITELRESRLALEAKQTELRAVVESTPDAVLMVDPGGEILFANTRTETMFGYSHRELIGKKVEILVPRSHKQHHGQHREAYAKAPHARPMGTGLELYGLRKDGSEFPVEISLGPVEGGAEPRIVASVRDVTEHRRLERELQNRKIQELAQVMIRELDGRVVQWNAGMKRMYGFSRGEAEGSISHELLRTAFPGPLGSIEAELLRTGFWEGELMHRRKDGSRIYVNSYWVLHCDKDGKPRLVLESSTDITALKEAEAQTRLLNQELERQNADLTLAKALIEAQTQKIAVAAKMSALGEMAGGMAHEINNPMGIIHARASDLLEFAEERENVPSKMVADAMEKIRNTASRVTKITLGLRKFARETRNDPVAQVALKEIIEDTLSFCTQRLKQSSVELRVAPVQESLEISCRPTEISQVLLNLLNNSVDAVQKLPEKWVEVTARDTGAELEIAVVDSGSGIPERVRERMGQPFFTTKEIGQGTGLGLSISRGIVEAHGGHLTLDTASAHTRFVVTLPKSAAIHHEAVPAGAKSGWNLPPLSG